MINQIIELQIKIIYLLIQIYARMKSKLRFLILFLCVLIVSGTYAQTKEWSGYVRDAAIHDPLIGVSVSIKGSGLGTITDIDGRFSIRAVEGQTLVFTYVGYSTLELTASNQTNFNNILMHESVRELEEVIVVGYGVQKKVSSVGSISAAKGEDLLKTGNVTSVSEALQGLMPGVVSIMTDSKPGADQAEILIRAKGSWVSSKPLILVDGIERDMNDVDANEIESLSVLKDASATAVYGVKGANGVILVTTKRGVNAKPTIRFSSNFGFKQPTNKPEYADYVTSMNYWNEAATNDQQWSKLIPQSTIDAWENAFATGDYGKNHPYFPQIDWWDEIVRDVGYQQQYNINIQGGTDFMRYFSSIGYLNDGDIFKSEKNDMFDPSFKYQRYNWRSNFDFHLTKSTVLSINLSGKQGYRSQTGYRMNENNESASNWGQPQFFSKLYNSPRNMFPILWEDGSYGLSSLGTHNLMALFDRGQRIYKYYQNFIDVKFTQDLDFITKGLSFNTKFSYNSSSNTRSDLQRSVGGSFGEGKVVGYYREWDYSQPLADGGYALKNEIRWPNDDYQDDRPSASYDNMIDGGFAKRMYYEFALNYDRSFGNHNVTALALMNRNEIEGLKGGSDKNMQFKENDEAWVTRVTYNWKERYLAEFNGAYTGSQKFARGQRFQFFPSYSVGWRISEEPFIKSFAAQTLTNLKLRYSSGIVGFDRSASAYTYVQIYNNAGGNVSFGEVEKTNYGPLYTEGKAANENATWETAYKQNLGIDVLLFNKLSATVDLYSEKREGILMTVTTPSWFGIKEPDGNIGKTKSRGIEIEIGWNDRINKDWGYSLKANYAINENRIVYRNDAPNLVDYLKFAGKPIGVNKKLQQVGYYQSLDDIFNYSVANNVATQSTLIPGDFMYADYDANGIIDNNFDKIPMKYNNYPQNTYGGTIGVNYKSLQLTAMIYGVVNVYKDVSAGLYWDFNDGNAGNYNTSPDVISRWTPENASNSSKPALHSDYRGYSMTGGTSYIYQNASYLRLKNLELSYTLQNKPLQKIGIKNIQLYANGNNLFTITDFYKYIDPEGNSINLYPLVKRYNVGTRITF
ncbi:MAG: TonB-dependent receptor [Pigmentiphaga sp.]|nr:TonB-dependent receptor [Pigmentiphaga sp.]